MQTNNPNIPNQKITAAGILCISKNNYIIAFARKGDETQLGLPAGKREQGEKLEETAERELFEETGFKVVIPQNAEVFVYKPDDKQRDNIDEYCATFIVRLEQDHTGIRFKQANLTAVGQPKGHAVWVKPEDFIHHAKSAFIDYNTNLLKFADLIHEPF